VGDYELNPQIRMHSERLLSQTAFLAEAKARLVVTPDAALAAMVRASAPEVQIEQIDHPNSGVIARLGWQHLQRGETVPPEDLEANYIRQSDAEIFSKLAS
jgi:tRNA A37 threonylcarbamoyladenosine modification protein TsaB